MAEIAHYKFSPAKREGVGLFIGLAGGTGSGKTFSALRLARGIVGPDGKIAAADSEGRRMSHYAGMMGGFDVTDLEPPFRPDKYEQVAKDAEAAGYKVLIVDSMSHEWSGDGGVVEWHDEELDRAYAKAVQNAREGDTVDEERVRNANNMRAWIRPKTAHKQMVQSFLQRRIPVIFCFRAEEKIKVLPNGRIEAMGWTPIGDQRFMFELTVMITLANDRPGCVNYDLPRKIQEQHMLLFPDKKPITEDAGAKLAAWARGEDIVPEKKAAPAKKEPEQKPAAAATTSGGELALGDSDKAAAAAKRIIDGVAALKTRIAEAKTGEAVTAILQEAEVRKQLAYLSKNRKDLNKEVIDAANARRRALRDAKKAA